MKNYILTQLESHSTNRDSQNSALPLGGKHLITHFFGKTVSVYGHTVRRLMRHNPNPFACDGQAIVVCLELLDTMQIH
jgi:hypothetical protein